MSYLDTVLLTLYILGLPISMFLIFKNIPFEDGFEHLCGVVGVLGWPILFLLLMTPVIFRKATLREALLFPDTNPSNLSLTRFMFCKTFHKLEKSTWIRSSRGEKIKCSCQRVYFFDEK